MCIYSKNAEHGRPYSGAPFTNTGIFHQVYDCIPSYHTWGVTVRCVRRIPPTAGRENHLCESRCENKSVLPAGSSWNNKNYALLFYNVPQTCSCAWLGTGSSFSLDTASALCSAGPCWVSVPGPGASPLELVRTRLLLLRRPGGGVQSWKVEGRNCWSCWYGWC